MLNILKTKLLLETHVQLPFLVGYFESVISNKNFDQEVQSAK